MVALNYTPDGRRTGTDDCARHGSRVSKRYHETWFELGSDVATVKID